MTLTELRDEIRTLIQGGNFKFTNLSTEAREAFRQLFTTARGKRFVQEQIDILREFWFRAAPPDHQAVIDANALLPADRQITPVQAENGNWYVNVDILTDESTWGPIFPFLRNVTIERNITFPVSEEVA